MDEAFQKIALLLGQIAKDGPEGFKRRRVAWNPSRSGYVVSTIYALDESRFETALLCGESGECFPVERYDTLDGAADGHARWLRFAHDCVGRQVTVLGGWDGLVLDWETTL